MSRIIHPCPGLACPAGTYIQGCGCFPIKPLPPTKRGIHCDLVCPAGTAYDPNGFGACNCAKQVPPTPVPAPVLKQRSPAPQGGPNQPVCRFVCPPGTTHDPNGPLCNCDFITTTPAPATSVMKARNALPSIHCNLICETPGYHTSPNGCSCIKDTPSAPTPAAAPPALEKRDPLTGRKCTLVCAEPGYHTSPNGCGCVKDTTPAKRAFVCEIACAQGSHFVPPCSCVKDLETRSTPVLQKRDGFEAQAPDRL